MEGNINQKLASFLAEYLPQTPNYYTPMLISENNIRLAENILRHHWFVHIGDFGVHDIWFR